MDKNAVRCIVHEEYDDKIVFRDSCKERHRGLDRMVKQIYALLIAMFMMLIKIAFFSK